MNVTLKTLNALDARVNKAANRREDFVRAEQRLAEQRRKRSSFSDEELRQLASVFIGHWVPPGRLDAAEFMGALLEALPDIYRVAELRLAAKAKAARAEERLLTAQLEAALSAIPVMVEASDE